MSGSPRAPTTGVRRSPSVAPVATAPLGVGLGWSIRPPSAAPLALTWDAHSAAVAGIVALAVLGGVLVVRNRLEQRNSFVAESETRHEEFMTDREKVRRLISDNGGRMKQSAIVDSVDWSKAKVSRLLAELEEDDQVTKLRLGRENLVCLPGNEPTASQSPEQPKSE